MIAHNQGQEHKAVNNSVACPLWFGLSLTALTIPYLLFELAAAHGDPLSASGGLILVALCYVLALYRHMTRQAQAPQSRDATVPVRNDAGDFIQVAVTNPRLFVADGIGVAEIPHTRLECAVRQLGSLDNIGRIKHLGERVYCFDLNDYRAEGGHHRVSI